MKSLGIIYFSFLKTSNFYNIQRKNKNKNLNYDEIQGIVFVLVKVLTNKPKTGKTFTEIDGKVDSTNN